MDVQAAAALLAELPERDEALAAEVATAEQRDRQQRAEATRVQGLAAELDLRVSSRPRRRFFGMLALLALVWNALSLGGRALGSRGIRNAPVLGFGVAFALVITALTVLSRRGLFRNAINRRVALLPLVAAWMLLAHRALGVWRGTAVDVIVTEDLVLLAGIATTAAVLLMRAYALPAAVFAAGAVLATAAPSWSREIFSLFGSLGMMSVFLFWSGDAPQERS